MKFQFIKIIVLALLLFSLANCKKDNAAENETPQGIVTESYPNQVGDSWLYLLYNSGTYSYDRLRITNTGTTKLANGLPVSKLMVEYPTVTDTNFIYVTKDTIRLYETRAKNSCLEGYVLPLSKGKTWSGFNNAMSSDKTTVIKEITIEVFPHMFYKGYEMYRQGWIFEGGYSYIFWYVPGIGVVKKFRRTITGDSDVDMELIEINFTPK